jgi:hypothetical protein
VRKVVLISAFCLMQGVESIGFSNLWTLLLSLLEIAASSLDFLAEFWSWFTFPLAIFYFAYHFMI